MWHVALGGGGRSMRPALWSMMCVSTCGYVPAGARNVGAVRFRTIDWSSWPNADAEARLLVRHFRWMGAAECVRVRPITSMHKCWIGYGNSVLLSGIAFSQYAVEYAGIMRTNASISVMTCCESWTLMRKSCFA